MTLWKNFRCGRESRGNELLGCGAKTPNVRLRGQGGRGRACPCPPKACPCPRLLSLLLLLAVLLSSAHAQTPPISPIDRAAAYQNALPLYQYDATRPLALKIGATQTIGTTKFLRFSYLSTHNQRVPALLFTPPKSLRKPSRAVCDYSARPRRQQRDDGRAGPDCRPKRGMRRW